MRYGLALALSLVAVPALAQQPGQPNFNNMRPADAARVNEAVRNDPNAKAAVEAIGKKLTESGHPTGKVLEQTRR